MRIRTTLQNRRPRAVTKQHTGVAVGPIHNRRKFFRADDQHGVIGARHDELLPDFQTINETGTRRLQIKRRRPVRADFLLDDARRCRKRHVRRDGGDNDEVNLVGSDAGLFHRPLRRVRRHVRSEFIPGRQPPRFDAGARDNPFIRRVHHFFQVGIGQDFRRQIRADTGDGTGAALKIKLGARVFKLGAHAEAGMEIPAAASFSLACAISRAMILLT